MVRTSWMVVVPAAVAAVAIGVVAWRFAWLVAPLSATGETERLAAALEIGRGTVVADIGAGSGAMAERMTQVVGPTGKVYATELSARRLEGLTSRKRRGGLDTLHVATAAADATGLPDACCDALYLRHVFHHIADRATFVTSLSRAVRPGGRIAVIDFAPGGLWFLGADHGVTADDVRATFWQAGWRQRNRDDAWGSGTFLVVFER